MVGIINQKYTADRPGPPRCEARERTPSRPARTSPGPGDDGLPARLMDEPKKDVEPVHEPRELPKPHLEHLQEPRPPRPALGPQAAAVELWRLAPQ